MMMKAKLLGAAAILTAAITWPALTSSSALARPVVHNPACAQFDPNCQYSAPYAGSYHRRTAYRYDNRWDRSGFWPGDVAAGIVGGAIGTAGAIASAPFRAFDAYAYDNSYYGWDHRSYAQRDGFVCTPGTWFRGDDGRRHICQ